MTSRSAWAPVLDYWAFMARLTRPLQRTNRGAVAPESNLHMELCKDLIGVHERVQCRPHAGFYTTRSRTHPYTALQVQACAAHGVQLCGQRARAAECWTGPPYLCPVWTSGACMLPSLPTEQPLAGIIQTRCKVCLTSMCPRSKCS